MNLKLSRKWVASLAALAVLAAGSATMAASAVAAPVEQGNVLKFDIAENGKKFVWDETPLHPDGKPAYGGEFVTQGYIYPAGTLDGTNGVLPDGSPEFPDKVIGEWTCSGWHVGDGAHTKTGPWVFTTQMYNFGNDFGKQTIVTSGYEIVDTNADVARAIIGGTGKYQNARGEQHQQMVGFNKTEGVVLRVEIKTR